MIQRIYVSNGREMLAKLPLHSTKEIRAAETSPMRPMDVSEQTYTVSEQNHFPLCIQSTSQWTNCLDYVRERAEWIVLCIRYVSGQLTVV